MYSKDKEIDVLEMMHRDLQLLKHAQPTKRESCEREQPNQDKRPFWEALELLASPAR